MSTLTSISTPLDSLNTARMSQARDKPIDNAQLKTSEDTDKVAKQFEALLIHSMLKAMRSTTLGDKPSNERAMYDDMFDQEISKQLTESGGLGIASSIARQLNAQNGIDDKAPQVGLDYSELDANKLSNHPNTLALNGKLMSAVDNLSQYQSMMNQVESAGQLVESNNGSISANNIAFVSAADERSSINTKQQFINSLMPDAQRSAARLGIEPNIVVAIAALETGWGKHMIKDSTGANSHNLFGIKAHGSTDSYMMHKTTEFIDNRPVTIDAAFRRYDNNASAVNDFAQFLLTNPRYENALNAKADNHNFLRELQRAGYATDPEYANKAINVLKQIESMRQDPNL